MARQLERFDNLVSLFLTRAQEKGEAPFLWAKRDGAWQSISWSEAARQVAALSASLQRIGLQPGDRVALVSENRPEWLIADLGIMAAGCVTVPTYTTNTTRDHAHILGNSGARAVIVSSQKLARNLVPAVLTSAECHHIIGIEDIRAGQVPDWVNVHHWAELTAGDADVEGLREREKKVGRNDLACIIYTSGTGGAPRGVQQHHGAILCNLEACTDIISSDFGGNPPYEKMKEVARICFKHWIRQSNVLFIIGGKSNNTDIFETFRAMADALREHFSTHGPTPLYVVVGRGGPNLVRGMGALRDTLDSLGLPYTFFGFDSDMSEVVQYAKQVDAWMKAGGRGQVAASLGIATIEISIKDDNRFDAGALYL